jgi:hypothetical protein
MMKQSLLAVACAFLFGAASVVPCAGQQIRTLKLVEKNGEYEFASGTEYFLTVFQPQGGEDPSFSADYRSTKWDISAVAKKAKRIPLGVQEISGRMTHEIAVNPTGLESFTVDKYYIVFPGSDMRLGSNGPSVRLRFFLKKAPGADSRGVAAGWEIRATQGNRLTQGRLSKEGDVDLLKVGLEPIKCVLRSPAGRTYQYVVYPSVRGAITGIVFYSILDIDDPMYESRRD